MLTITVSCLPRLSEDQLQELHQKLVQAMKSVDELGVKGEESMLCLFPPDMMAYGLGSEIFVRIEIPFEGLDQTDAIDAIRDKAVDAIGPVIKKLFPEADVLCRADGFEARHGFRLY